MHRIGCVWIGFEKTSRKIPSSKHKTLKVGSIWIFFEGLYFSIFLFFLNVRVRVLKTFGQWFFIILFKYENLV